MLVLILNYLFLFNFQYKVVELDFRTYINLHKFISQSYAIFILFWWQSKTGTPFIFLWWWQEGEGATAAAAEETKKSNHVLRKIEKRQEERKLDAHIEEQFGGGRLLACISSRPGQCGRADG